MAAQGRIDGMSLGDLLAGMSVRETRRSQTVIPASVADIEIAGLQLDSRKIQAGDVFIAVPGFDKTRPADGRQFIAQAVAAGAIAVLAEQDGWPVNLSLIHPVPVLLVKGLSAQISAIAGRFYGQASKSMQVIGFTGTNGKTTSSHLLAQIFNLLGVKTGVLGTLGYGVPTTPVTKTLIDASLGSDDFVNAEKNNAGLVETGLTTPDAIASQAILAEMYADNIACVAMEVSSHSLEQGRVDDVEMSGAVFTNLSQEHLDYHGSMENYLAAKQKLFEKPGLDFAVINIDDPAGVVLADALGSDIQCYSYSLSDVSPTGRVASLYGTNIRLSVAGISADIVTPWGEACLNSRLIGDFNLSNILAVIATACASGLAFEKVLAAVAQLSPVPGRLEVIDADTGPAVVIDYAHTPDALAQTLIALRGTRPDLINDSNAPVHEKSGASGRLWCVFGCGGDRDNSKRATMGRIADELADEMVVTSDNPRSEVPAAIIDAILAGVDRSSPRIHRIEDRAEAIDFAIRHAQPQDTVLIAGKGHEDYQIIGDRRLPFSDAGHARLALLTRRGAHD